MTEPEIAEKSMLSHEQNALFNTDSSTPSPITTQYEKICTPPLPSEIVSYSFFGFAALYCTSF